MDQKKWLWRKRSSEKTTVSENEAEFSPKGNAEEMLHYEKEKAWERSVKSLHEKLSSLLSECNAKDNLVADHAKLAQETIVGREKAEAEMAMMKQELDKALQEKDSANERLMHLNAALRDCREQLSSAREEQDQRVHEAVIRTSKELERTRKRLANLDVENSQLSKALMAKEQFVEDVHEQIARASAEFDTLMARLDSVEKENTFLKFEFRMLQKELEVRNEEMEFARQSADVLHKKHLESGKKITRLEAECQRLRVLVRKRLPCAAAFGKMKSEVEIKGRNRVEITRRRKLNPMNGGLIIRDIYQENPCEVPEKGLSFVIERLCEVEEENKIFKEIVERKDDELCSLRTEFSLLASKLARAEDKLRDRAKSKRCMELVTCNSVSIDIKDEIEHSGSWASALLSELEKFRHEETDTATKCKMIGDSDMSLMDDFVEMEKLAIVSVERETSEHHLDSVGKELVPVTQSDSNEMDSRDKISRDWLQDVLKVILEQNHASRRSVDELVEDIRLALQYTYHSSSNPAEIVPVSGYITWKSPNTFPSPNFRASIEGNEGLEQNMNAVKEIQESEQSIGSLQTEMVSLKKSKTMVEDEVENQMLINEDLNTQLTIVKAQLNELVQKLSSLEVELEDRSQCCEELEATCLELQLQLMSVSTKDGLQKDDLEQEGKVLQTEWKTTAVCAKLAECQETILNLRKQLKVLASPNEAEEVGKVLSTTNSKMSSQHSSLRDHILAENGANITEDLNSPKTKRIISTTEAKQPFDLDPTSCNALYQVKNAAPSTLAIVPSNKRVGASGLLRKLLFRRKKGSHNKIQKSLTFPA